MKSTADWTVVIFFGGVIWDVDAEFFFQRHD